MIISVENPKYSDENLSVRVPFIKDNDFWRIMLRYDSYVKSYNYTVNQIRGEGFKHVQTLKCTHRALFSDLANQVKGQLIHYRKLFSDTQEHLAIDPAKPYVLYTNNKRIKDRTQKDHSTTWRNIERLIDAGIIVKKVNHGTRADYELHLNPEFLIISDLTEMYGENTEKCASQGGLAAKSKPFYINKNTLNNQIIDVNSAKLRGVSLSVDPLQLNTQEHSQEHRKLGENLGAEQALSSKELKKEQIPGEKFGLISDLDRMRISFSTWLVQYMLTTIFFNHKHYNAVIYNAVQYSTIYFDGCKTIDEFMNRQKVLKWRVDKVQSYINRKQFNFSNIYLTSYLDTNNKKSGFINTAKWYKNHLEMQNKQVKRKDIKLIKCDKQKLLEAINRLDAIYIEGRFTVKEFVREDDYVTRNIPHLYKDFLQFTEYMRNNRYKQITQTA